MPITRTRHFGAAAAAPKELTKLPDFKPNPGNLLSSLGVAAEAPK